MTDPFKEINDAHGLTLHADILITVNGYLAKIVGAEGKYLKVVFNCKPGIEKLIHPTEGVKFPK